MREPDFEVDGWCLESGEAYHGNAPDTFWIPTKGERENLQVGDFVKLIFRIHVDDPDDPIPAEGMSVIVREKLGSGYLGILDNDPDALAENSEFWSRVELPFAPHHVIAIMEGDAKSLALAEAGPSRSWPRD